MKKTKKYLLFSLSLSFLTISLLVYGSVEEGIIKSLSYIKARYVFLAIILHILGWFFWSIRTKILSSVVGLNLGLKKIFGITLSSLFIGSLAPAYFGDFSRIYFFRKTKDGSTGTSSSIVFIERFLDLNFLLIIGVLSLIFIGQELIYIPKIGLIFVIIGAIISLVFLTVILTLLKPSIVKKIIKKIFWPIKKIRPNIVYSISDQVDFFQLGLKNFLKKGKKELLAALVFTILFWSLALTIPYVIIRGVGAEIAFLRAWSSYTLVLGMMLIPLTPGASGIAEISFTLVYTTVAEIPLIGIVVLLWRLSTYYMNLTAGGIISGFYLKNLDEVENNVNYP